MPVERQCTRFARAGVVVAPQTLGRGVCATIDVIEPIAKVIEEQTRAPGLLGTDSTVIAILDPSVPAGIRSGAMWCWTNARWVSFFYSSSGDSDSVRRFLKHDLVRIGQCDGTSITTSIERSGGRRPGCWSHDRRRLVEAARSGDQLALEGLRIIARIFAVERAASSRATPPTSAAHGATSTPAPSGSRTPRGTVRHRERRRWRLLPCTAAILDRARDSEIALGGIVVGKGGSCRALMVR
jgi:hypothetical protein